ncbi:peptidylprolyl isomerase SurA [Candidatus Erwinia haradaeae]|uniref:Chaperone SurA n=1 Tax=Candidatus Erwinia haradaeae TaxID=1922217 RepID=A0A451D954_9GAMM|nr:peptidylprolyl isomerase SurA [Candidatus Erwinia haradaeae]VFP82244.1 Chaperone SurA [Candidatus Erwinia haradaeae]
MTYWKVLVLSAGLVSSTAFSSPHVVDQVAAVVNHSVVLKSDADRMIQSIKNEAIKTGQSLPNKNVLYHQVLEQLIINSILLQKSKQLGLYVNDSQLQKAISKIAQQKKMSVSQLIRSLSDSGINYASYREMIRHNLMVLELRTNEVRRRFSIMPEEINSLVSYLEAQNSSNFVFKLSHILLPLSENLTQKEALNRENMAVQLVHQARTGSNFSKLVTDYSSGVQNLIEEDMGWRKLRDLPSLFSSFLMKANKGDIIGPIRSGMGWHILKVNDIDGKKKKISSHQVHVRHVFLRSSPVVSDSQLRSKLLQVSSEISNGRIFSQVEQDLYQDFQSEYNGGDLGWRGIEEFDDLFRNILVGLKNGEVSQPIHSDSGWHIVQLLDSRVIDITDMEQKEEAYQILLERKLPIATLDWIEDERHFAYVKICDENN